LEAGLPDGIYILPVWIHCTKKIWQPRFGAIVRCRYRNIFQMAIKYINIFQSNALHNLPKL
jgi:hypothetical protein